MNRIKKAKVPYRQLTRSTSYRLDYGNFLPRTKATTVAHDQLLRQHFTFQKQKHYILPLIVRLTTQTIQFFLLHSAASLGTLGTGPLVHTLRGFWRDLDTSSMEPVGAHVASNVKSKAEKIILEKWSRGFYELLHMWLFISSFTSSHLDSGQFQTIIFNFSLKKKLWLCVRETSWIPWRSVTNSVTVFCLRFKMNLVQPFTRTWVFSKYFHAHQNCFWIEGLYQASFWNRSKMAN